MQVLHELVRIVAKTMKFIKLHKTHSMAMVYKAVSVNANANDNRLMNLWSRSKLQYAKTNKNIKMEMTLDKSNTIVTNKPLKPNMLFATQYKPSMSTIAKYVYKKSTYDECDNKKSHALRSAKNEEPCKNPTSSTSS